MNKKGAFTLVELMVAMAIIAVLIGLAAFGITTLQRLSRDNQRRQTVINFQTYLEGYYNDFFEYPELAELTITETNISVTGYTQKGPELKGPARIGTTTNLDATVYCYGLEDDGYILGAQLESGEFFNSGTSQNAKCDANSTSSYLVP
jgi:prepilin-type N-terminal cleavage/methylation domain-containing protein